MCVYVLLNPGFRKLRTDPILTSDLDPQTACYVRFYHEKFQKDRPELLHQIKRATKSDQQSKDDVESLKAEVSKLKDCIQHMSAEVDRKLAEMSYDYNRRISSMSNEYDKLATLVHQILAHQQLQQQQQQHTQHLLQQQQQPPSSSVVAFTTAGATDVATPTPLPSITRVPDLMQSLSTVAAMSLQNQLRPPSCASVAAEAMLAATKANGFGIKRTASDLPEEDDTSSSPCSRARKG
jgi:phage host-nuclease inhibitor protein Gam